MPTFYITIAKVFSSSRTEIQSSTGWPKKQVLFLAVHSIEDRIWFQCDIIAKMDEQFVVLKTPDVIISELYNGQEIGLGEGRVVNVQIADVSSDDGTDQFLTLTSLPDIEIFLPATTPVTRQGDYAYLIPNVDKPGSIYKLDAKNTDANDRETFEIILAQLTAFADGASQFKKEVILVSPEDGKVVGELQGDIEEDPTLQLVSPNAHFSC